jgi:hypothetical protein
MKKLIAIILILILIALLVGGVLFIKNLSNDFTTEIKTFFLLINGKIVTENLDGVSIMGTPIKVHTVLENITNSKGFSYVIKPNEDFTFYVDGVATNLTDIQYYTPFFDASTTDTSIIISKTSVTEVLQKAYEGHEVVLPTLDKDTCYFTLVLTSLNGQNSIELNFIANSNVKSITLDQTDIVF